jgi:hypothetical protein
MHNLVIGLRHRKARGREVGRTTSFAVATLDARSAAALGENCFSGHHGDVTG